MSKVSRKHQVRAAGLRSRHRSLRLPDALSLATALMAGADLVTLDQRLRRVARSEQRTD
jgi:predicted nucleic acid-binding protein